MKQRIVFSLILLGSIWNLNAQIYSTIEGPSNNGNIGIGIQYSRATLEIRNPPENNNALEIGPIGDSHSNLRIDKHNGRDGGILLTKDRVLDYQIVNFDNRDFNIYSYSKQAYVFNIQNVTGNIGIGTTNPQYKLDVNGTIHAREVKIDLNLPADYVFKSDYQLLTLTEVEQFIKINNHLPEIPSAAEIKKNGLNMGEMQNKLLQKIKELTLYMLEQNKQMEQQKKVIEELRQILKIQNEKIEKLESTSN